MFLKLVCLNKKKNFLCLDDKVRADMKMILDHEHFQELFFFVQNNPLVLRGILFPCVALCTWLEQTSYVSPIVLLISFDFHQFMRI